MANPMALGFSNIFLSISSRNKPGDQFSRLPGSCFWSVEEAEDLVENKGNIALFRFQLGLS